MPVSYSFFEEENVKQKKSLDLICFSHLRWDYIYHRPQHILTRFATKFRVFFVEEPIMYEGDDKFEVTITKSNVWRVVPMLSTKKVRKSLVNRQIFLLKSMFSIFEIKEYIFWYYSPMAIKITREFFPVKVIYDCIEEFSVQKHISSYSPNLETELLRNSDLVFTTGINLYNAKQEFNSNTHLFPCSLDKEHFLKARLHLLEPFDQSKIPHPRIGYFGVIDERFDMNLLQEVANARPHWHFVLIGPVVRIKIDELPKNKNIHYLGGKSYDVLPKYLSRWDVAMIPFKINLSTKFINPGKTPEYLAGGKAVVSTAIKEIKNLYSENKLVTIVNTAYQFINGIEHELHGKNKKLWLQKVDEYLSTTSWDKTFSKMLYLLNRELNSKKVIFNVPALQNNNNALVLHRVSQAFSNPSSPN